MQNNECIEMFEKHLRDEKKASANTLSSYLRDIRQLAEYLDSHSENTIVEANAEELGDYIAMLRSAGKSVATVSRAIASIKSLYSHLFIKQLILLILLRDLFPIRILRSFLRSLPARKSSFCLSSLTALTPRVIATTQCLNYCMPPVSELQSLSTLTSVK